MSNLKTILQYVGIAKAKGIFDTVKQKNKKTYLYPYTQIKQFMGSYQRHLSFW